MIVNAAIDDVSNAYPVNVPPEHVIVKGDDPTGVEYVYELVHFGAFGSGAYTVPSRETGFAIGPVGEPV